MATRKTTAANIEDRLSAIEARLNSRALPDAGPGATVLGSILRQRRKAHNLTMDAVKQRGGPSKAFQCDIETGKKQVVSIQVLLRWCAAIGCDPVEVFSDCVEGMRNKEPTPRQQVEPEHQILKR